MLASCVNVRQRRARLLDWKNGRSWSLRSSTVYGLMKVFLGQQKWCKST